jgi:hypothetical protein
VKLIVRRCDGGTVGTATARPWFSVGRKSLVKAAASAARPSVTGTPVRPVRVWPWSGLGKRRGQEPRVMSVRRVPAALQILHGGDVAHPAGRQAEEVVERHASGRDGQ